MTHQRLECQKRVTGSGASYPCPGVLGFFWGGATKVRALQDGEDARSGFDQHRCPKCKQQWEIDRSSGETNGRDSDVAA